ncbi:MAG: matrixin family metalloprotease, partial [Pyrinomonadaceae bacterium]
SIFVVVALLSFAIPVRPSIPDFADEGAPRSIRWHAKTIRIGVSSSLNSPGSAIKPGSDVIGAVRRALKQWSRVADIRFIDAATKVQSISAASGGDGINLITIAATVENLKIFNAGNSPARTRVFYDTATGEIDEADIALNPALYSEWGIPIQFSTDGTPGTYDLESTIAHEVGHLLGLDHSNLISSTMQACQAVNGVNSLPAFTQRTLSEADQTAVRSIYGLGKDAGAIEGRILNNVGGNALVPVTAAHVWVENSSTGRIVASTVTDTAGGFHIEGVATGEYRVLTEFLNGPIFGAPVSAGDAGTNMGPRGFRSVEISQVRVASESTSTVNYVFVPPQNSLPRLNPRFLGANGDLSIVSLPASAGKKIKVYLAGDGLDQVPGSGISVTSPFFTVDAGSLTVDHFGSSIVVISFDVSIAPDAPFGDYSFKLQAHSGEVAYIPGGITLEPQKYSTLSRTALSAEGTSLQIAGPGGFFALDRVREGDYASILKQQLQLHRD